MGGRSWTVTSVVHIGASARALLFVLLSFATVAMSGCKVSKVETLYGDYLYSDGYYTQRISLLAPNRFVHVVKIDGTGKESERTGIWSFGEREGKIERVFLENFVLVASEKSYLQHETNQEGATYSAPAVGATLFGEPYLEFDPNLNVVFRK